MRIVIWIVAALLLFAAGLFCGWFANGLLSNPADVPTIAFYDDWRLACPAVAQKDRSCVLNQDLVDGKSHAQVAHLTITELKGQRILIATVPYGVLISEGLGLGLDKDKVRVFAFRTCDTVGCVARIPADDALLASLRKAQQGRLLFAALDKRVIALPFSLHGFDRAAQAYAASQAKRSLLAWGAKP